MFTVIYDLHCKNITADLTWHTNRTNVNVDSAFVGIGTIFCGKSEAQKNYKNCIIFLIILINYLVEIYLRNIFFGQN